MPTNPDTQKKATEPQKLRIEEAIPRGKESWSKSHHGLKIAVKSQIVDAKQHQVAVVVRNTLDTPIKIVPGHPELQVRTLDNKGRVLQCEPIARLKVSSTAPDGMIASKKTARYLIGYEAPILGAKQRLCVAVAQTNAADEPVIVELTSGKR